MVCTAVFFDLDGTLVDSNGFHVEVWHRVFADEGHDIAAERIASQIGKGADQLVPALLPDASEEDVERIGEAHGTLFKREYLSRVQPFPGATDLVRRVHAAGRKVVLASSAGKGELDHYIDLLAIGDLVDTVTTIDDVGNSKPAPDIFTVARQKAEVDADGVVVIGDSPFDMQGARRDGLMPLAVRSGGFGDGKLLDAGADALYDDVADLLRRFDESPIAA